MPPSAVYLGRIAARGPDDIRFLRYHSCVGLSLDLIVLDVTWIVRARDGRGDR
jgi:hypothetical protein